jgi:hypothetical protein
MHINSPGYIGQFERRFSIGGASRVTRHAEAIENKGR